METENILVFAMCWGSGKVVLTTNDYAIVKFSEIR